MNVLGTLNVTAEAVPALRSAGGGTVVNFASIDAFAVSPGQLPSSKIGRERSALPAQWRSVTA
ncbi:hypothetical protein ABT009_24855 [Streptomyces sp. NPDC002896]|uniref:hypothetical protein n=1 Tax=Streptomyces sp. NPDC002896 TaxID=3154438 RepID=UPI00331A16BD